MRGRARAKRAAALLLSAGVLLAGAASAQNERSTGQTVYVPLYSEVPFGDRSGTLLVRASVVIRNLDSEHPLLLESAAYHDSEGARVREYVEAPVSIPPFASRSFYVKETDTKGGSTPSMLVRWQAGTAITPPIAEGLMVSIDQNLGLAFRTEGRVLTPAPPSR